MNIVLELQSYFTRYTGGVTHYELQVDKGTLLKDILNDIPDIPGNEIGFAVVNKIRKDWDTPLKDGDIVKLYTVIISG